jgi:hypothetical protein
MPRTPLSFAPLSSSPHPQGWAQAYSAGNIAAALSLTRITTEAQTSPQQTLSAVGKDMLRSFEAEYFTLETKTLASIKQALSDVCSQVPADIRVSFVLGVILHDILYVFIYGQGLVFLTRGDAFGTLLHGKEPSTITSASGIVQHNDCILLSTESFAHTVGKDTIKTHLTPAGFPSLVSDLAPLLAGYEQGDASAIGLWYQDASTSPQPHAPSSRPASSSASTSDIPHPDTPDETPPVPASTPAHPKTLQTPLTLPIAQSRFSHRQRLFFTISLVALLALAGSIFFAVQKQQSDRISQAVASIIQPARDLIDQGKSLQSLNATVAREDFAKAQDLLAKADGQIPPGSSEYQQVESLRSELASLLSVQTQTVTTSTTPANESDSPYLAYLKANSGSVSTSDSTTLYRADDEGIFRKGTTSSRETRIITRGSSWEIAEDISVYLGNIYILDPQNNIRKFTPSGSSYSRTNYFTSDVPPLLSRSVSMAIDSAIYLLGSDGTIGKFSRGVQQPFQITALDTPLKNPTQIVTSAQMTRLYILDQGNARVVVLDKNGAFVASYASPQLAQATAIDVREKDKTIMFLSGESIYRMAIE